MRRLILFLMAALLAAPGLAETFWLSPARVFDGDVLHEGWSVRVEGDRIAAVGPAVPGPTTARVILLPNATVMPGMIEGHSHLFLHPYDEALWDDQVLHEPLGMRMVRSAWVAMSPSSAVGRSRPC